MATQSLSKTLLNEGQINPGMAVHAASAQHLDPRFAVCPNPADGVSDAIGLPLNETQYPAHQNVCGNRFYPYDLDTYLNRDQYVYAQLRDGGPEQGDYFQANFRANMNHVVGNRPTKVKAHQPSNTQATLNSFMEGQAFPVFHQ